MNRKTLLAALVLLLLPAFAQAQITTSYTFTVEEVANPDEVNANFDALEAQALNRTGGTITGNITVSPGVTLDGIDVGAVLGGTGTPTFASITVTGTAGITGAATVGSLASSGAISGTTGTFSGAVIGASYTTSGTITTTNTGASSVDIGGGLNAGTGNVGIIDSTGKIPAISSTYFASLSGANLTSLPAANLSGSVPAANGGVPSGMVAHFNLGACPSGWTDLTASYAGRYLIAKHSAQSNGATIGTALTNGENRAAGQHSHGASTSVTLSDPGHFHSYLRTTSGNDGATGASQDLVADPNVSTATDTKTTGITVSSSTTTIDTGTSLVAGTNAPYVAFLLCSKD